MTATPPPNGNSGGSEATLSPAELLVRIKALEADALELEKKIALAQTLKEEKKALEKRLQNLERAYYGLLMYLAHPRAQAFVERGLEVMKADLETLEAEARKAEALKALKESD